MRWWLRAVSAGFVISAAVVAVFVFPAGCSTGEQRQTERNPNEVESVSEKFSTLTEERLIPVRIVRLVNGANFALGWPLCSTPPTGAAVLFPLCEPEPANFGRIVADRFHELNEAYRPAGIQFYLKSVERYPVISLLKDTPNDVDLEYWSNVYPSLAQVVNIPSATPSGITEPQNGQYWMNLVSSRYGSPNEILLWMPKTNGGVQPNPPWEGRGFVHDWADFQAFQFVFPHEMGHFLGLSHAFDDPNGGNQGLWVQLHEDGGMTQGINPVTQGARHLSDYYDLVYKPGSPPTFYNDRNSAADAGLASLRAINTHNDGGVAAYNDGGSVGYCLSAGVGKTFPGNPDSNCCSDFDNQCGSVCALGGVRTADGGAQTPVYSWDAGMQGVLPKLAGALQDAGAEAGPDAAAWASNIMSYQWTDTRCRQGLSDSQIEVLRGFLRYDVNADTYKGSSASGVFRGQRPLLGTTVPYQPAFDIDFNGDSRRDIAVWEPPLELCPTGSTPSSCLGHFQIIASTSTGYSSTVTSIELGRIGDTPIVADFDGDGDTDVGVFRTGGPNTDSYDPFDQNAYWILCKGAFGSATSCSSQTTFTFGKRSQIPIVGVERDGNTSTKEVAVFDPFYSDTESSFQAAKASDGTTVESPFVFTGAASWPLQGFYDTDLKTDYATFEAATATVRLWRYTSASATSIFLGSAMMPNAQGKSGLVPSRAYYTSICFPPCNNHPQAFRFFEPDSLNIHTIWNPTAGTPTITSCAISGASATDVPIDGYFDHDNDGKSDFMMYRPRFDVSSSQLFMQHNSVSGSPSCSGTATTRSPTTLSRNTKFFPSFDLTGDSLPELWYLDSATMRWRYLTSDDYYQTSVGNWQLGSARVVPL